MIDEWSDHDERAAAVAEVRRTRREMEEAWRRRVDYRLGVLWREFQERQRDAGEDVTNDCCEISERLTRLEAAVDCLREEDR
jgi:hypothetical protein